MIAAAPVSGDNQLISGVPMCSFVAMTSLISTSFLPTFGVDCLYLWFEPPRCEPFLQNRAGLVSLCGSDSWRIIGSLNKR